MTIDREKLKQDIENTKLPFQCYVDFQAILNNNKGLEPEAVELVFYETYCDPKLDEIYRCSPASEDFNKGCRIEETVKLVRNEFRARLRGTKSLKLLTTAAKEMYNMVEKVVVKRGKISTDTKYFEFHIDDKEHGRKGVFSIPSDKLLRFDNFKEYFFKTFDSLPPIVVPESKLKWAWDDVLTAINNNKQTVEEDPEESLEVYEANMLLAKICEKDVTHGDTPEELADVDAGHLLHLHKASGAVQNLEKNKMSYFITSAAVDDILEAGHYHTYVTTLSKVMSELGYKEIGNRNHRLGASNPKCWELKQSVVDQIKRGEFV